MLKGAESGREGRDHPEWKLDVDWEDTFTILRGS